MLLSRQFLRLIHIIASIIAGTVCGAAQERRVAITFDDLPFAQSGKTTCDATAIRERTEKLLAPFVRGKIPVTGFVIGNGCRDLPEADRISILKMWQKAGAELGNHTFSHPDLNRVSLTDYTTEIERTDALMKRWLGVERIAFFRSPYLHAGPTEKKKRGLEDYLRQAGQRQAVVTIDDSDWMFANVYAAAMDRGDEAMVRKVKDEYLPYLEHVTEFFERRAVEVVGRQIPHILLLHANWLAAEKVEDLLAMYKRRGYRFISIEEAMRDPAYQLPDGYIGTNGISWIHRWAAGKGMPEQREPDEPQWLLDEYKRLTSRQ